ncbi:putative disease resistance protein At3g14460 isoform X1 [Arachis ipaensis]|uniref:putative disease resistance protein At3g14460 isoform X1 n=1 Tax=Arachis ipaensis TaxID=130454 RepID=UPI0007AFB82F|nr:putative disease resistance protein At3g14460 isoform X1 [Arachis ipaensis]XP_020970781.1 putative disease resistance protein At3g14460 isoform X1 [Arachis ipaensis]XP_020970782.1 putative disease resistance protein At3g14460 isoform X1 [Arachis ipaensis]XP_020970784.1 putative disease resistance protein At3g14460 isoform X1 [Arachis ipaensis]XP_029146321.1 putative disease resistance protein At3g14460 isoform X1 [Arachis hypogaea]XP_029146322.1 putative disease resistance protein At3g14460
MAEALLSGFINVVLERLLSPEFVNLVVGKKLDRKLVDRLKTAILAAKALAADAEQKQFGHELVREWLHNLKDALYTADDLLDRVFIKAQIRSKVRTRLPHFLDLSGRKMVTKIEEVVERIVDLERCKDTLGLREIPTGSSSWRPPSTSLVKGNVFGRDGDQQALIKMLNDNNHHNLSVISIVGMGGIGKTTLAQWLYNNKDLMDGVDLKAWICVSENFDVVETTKNVIKGISSGVCSLDSFDLLQQDLKEKLSEKKFFIVLDDVWNEDADKWNSFITPFQHGSKGSTILLTTRKENVGPIVQHYNSHTLKELSDDYCWSIFADNASFPESNGSSELEEIGRKIVERCDGLPLAAETLGCLLRSEHRVEEWNKILFSDIWQFPTANCKIVPALLISYYHLPAHLKRCFVYCSLYPKDHKLDKDELILLWMAEDLLQPPRRGQTLEEVGCGCFDDLASRLFFKQVDNDDEKYFVMHDLMHDLATFLAGDLYCRFSEELGEKEEMSILTRHLSYCRFSKELGGKEETGMLTPHLSYDDSIPEKICSSSKIKSLRTLLYINQGACTWEDHATLPCYILSKNKYLRVLSFGRLNIFPDSIYKLIQLRYLDLSWSDIEVLPQSLCNLCNLQTLKLKGCSFLTILPSSLGELIHLRYLDLSRSDVETLPKSLCKLCNLQTLKLEGCSGLTMLPNGMYNLVNLRHLDIRGTPLKEMPKEMGKLKQLHILSNFVVGKQQQEDNRIQELGGLLNLHGSLEIQKLENVVDANQARSARIIDKKHIDELLLEWSLSSGDVMASDAQTERDILHSLQPHNGLKELRIWGYKGTIFPDWLGDCSYQNMTSVSLKSCKNCCMLPSLGQLPSLQSLRIQSFSQLKSVGMEFYKNEGHQHSSPIAPFPSLERLEFHNMPCWEEWHLPDSEAFPQLKGLEIRDCRMLKGDMLNQVLMKIVFSSSDVSKVRQLKIQEDHQGWGKRMTLDRDSLSIHGFESVVEYAFKARIIHHLTSLQEVHISRCSSVVSLGENCLPKSLQKLIIYRCSQIELLQQQHKYDLVHLQIEKSCDSLTSLSLDAFPNLKNLQIDECSNLESISMSEPPHAALQRLSINYCHKFVSFPEEGLAAPNLTHLSVIKCLKLEALPRGMNSLLPNLQSLDIRRCPNICRLPEGGSPPNLKELSVGECEQQLTGLSWLGNLDNLTRLTISGNDPKSIIESYPEVGLLPRLPSLTTLHIQEFDNLEIFNCNELLRLTSLQQLHIEKCSLLKNMAGEKLPSSLLLLNIKRCSLLGKHCKNKHQQIWPKISHIPTIQVDGEQIF